MSTPITINTAAVQFASSTLEAHCVVQADTILGPTITGKVLPLPFVMPPDLIAKLCAMVADELGVPVTDVSVAGGAAMRVASGKET